MVLFNQTISFSSKLVGLGILTPTSENESQTAGKSILSKHLQDATIHFMIYDFS